MRGQRRWSDRKRLCRRSHFSWDVALRHGALFDGKHWLASVAIQHVEQAGLVALNDDRDILFSVAQDCKQRRRRAIKIPQIVVHELKSPGDFAGLCAQRHHGIGPLVVAGPQATVIVGAGASGGNKDQISLRVDSHDRPGIARTAAKCFCTRRCAADWSGAIGSQLQRSVPVRAS